MWKNGKCDVTWSLPPPLPPVTNCHTFSDPLPPLKRDILYGRPLSAINIRKHDIDDVLVHLLFARLCQTHQHDAWIFGDLPASQWRSQDVEVGGAKSLSPIPSPSLPPPLPLPSPSPLTSHPLPSSLLPSPPPPSHPLPSPPLPLP